MSNEFTAFRIHPPGDVLLAELKSRKLSQRDLADILQRPPKTINEIIKAKKAITPETALQLEQALDIPAEFWIKLEFEYQLYKAKETLSALKNQNPEIQTRRLMQRIPLREMEKLGWLTLSKSVEENVRGICQFLNLPTLESPLEFKASFRKAATKEANSDYQYAWIQRVHQLASQQPIAQYNPEGFQAALPALLEQSISLETLHLIPELLKRLGVHFLLVPHLSKTYLDGAALYHNQNPVIVLTLRYNRLDSFWFNLLHEAGHILQGHVSPESQACLDSFEDRDSYRGTDETDIEQAADRFAQELLIPPRKYAHFLQTHPNLTEETIIEFAKKIKRHPGIVLGRLQHDEHVAYSTYRQLLPKVRDQFEAIFDKP